MGIFLLIIISLALLNLAWWWWADRKARTLPYARAWRISIALFALLQLVGFTSLMLLRGLKLAVPIPMPLMVLIYLWHLLAMPVFGVVAGLSLIVKRVVRSFSSSRTWRTAGRGARRPDEPLPISDLQSPLSPPLPEYGDRSATFSRRRFLVNAAVVAAPPLLASAGLTIAVPQLDSFRVRRLTIPLADLPRELDGMTIAQVSDVHVGRFTRSTLLARVAEATNQLRADLVVLTGDLIDFSLKDLPAGIDMVRRLDPRGALVMIEGNHDLFQSRGEFHSQVQSAGIDLLLNSSRTIRVRGREVQMLGLRWGVGEVSGRGALFDDHLAATLPLRIQAPDAFPILLSHHPHAFDHAADANLPLTLAGHTHGGQLNLTPNFGAGSILYRYWSGLYRRGNSALFVSNGVGNWFPLRVNAPAEVVHLTLRRA